MEAGRLRGVWLLADDAASWPHDPVAQARGACRGGATAVQLRAKHATDRQALAWAAEIRAITAAAGVLFFVNDRFDLALLAGADGVHLGQDDLKPAALPEDARARLCVGRSTHTREQARAATREPVDYVAFGPVFGTGSKASPYDARGLARLQDVAAEVAPLPLVAIGGIAADNARATLDAGACAIAVISAIAAAADPETATRELAASIAGAR